MTTENGGRETGPDSVFQAVLESLAETMGDGPMVTNAECYDFMDALARRGYSIFIGPCRPHEWTSDSVDAYCMVCGQAIPAQLSMGSLVATNRGLGYVKGMGDGHVLVEMLADEREVWMRDGEVEVKGHR